ncbi:MAG: NHL repeat-containing protein [Planctomycetes bacterium]|nr:NHL repeat-containing protein [Planctomycetota bacterium]
MYGALDSRGQLLAVGYCEIQAEIKLYDRARGVLRRKIVLPPAGEAGWADVSSLCFGDDHTLWVADAQASMLRRVSLFGQELQRFGGPSHAQRRGLDRKRALQHPNAVALRTDGLLVVACGDRPLVHGVQLYDERGRYAGRLASFGEEEESFGAPRGLSVDEERIYVADTRNGCVQVFSYEGAFLWMLSTATSPGERSLPSAVLPVPGGGLVVAQVGLDAALKLFDRDGVFLGELAPRSELCDPAGLAWGAPGQLWVADDLGRRVRKLELERPPVGAFSAPIEIAEFS